MVEGSCLRWTSEETAEGCAPPEAKALSAMMLGATAGAVALALAARREGSPTALWEPMRSSTQAATAGQLLLVAAAVATPLALVQAANLLWHRWRCQKLAHSTTTVAMAAANELWTLEGAVVEAVRWIGCVELAKRGFGAPTAPAASPTTTAPPVQSDAQPAATSGRSWGPAASVIEQSQLFQPTGQRRERQCVALRLAAMEALRLTRSSLQAAAAGAAADEPWQEEASEAAAQEVPTLQQLRGALSELRVCRAGCMLRLLLLRLPGSTPVDWLAEARQLLERCEAAAARAAGSLRFALEEEYASVGRFAADDLQQPALEGTPRRLKRNELLAAACRELRVAFLEARTSIASTSGAPARTGHWRLTIGKHVRGANMLLDEALQAARGGLAAATPAAASVAGARSWTLERQLRDIHTLEGRGLPAEDEPLVTVAAACLEPLAPGFDDERLECYTELCERLSLRPPPSERQWAETPAAHGSEA